MKFINLVASGATGMFLLLLSLNVAYGQSTTEDQLRSLLPTARELRGFVRFSDGSSIGEFVSTMPKGEFDHLGTGQHPELTVKDRIFMDRDQLTSGGDTEKCNIIERGFYTSDGNLGLAIYYKLCRSVAASKGAFLGNMGSAPQTQGRHSSSEEIGTESTFKQSEFPLINFYQSKVAVRIVGSQSNVARKSHSQIQYPAESLDSIAYLILLKAARHPELTDVKSRPVKVYVNDQAITSGFPIMVGKTVYVPAIDLAKKAGFAAKWDERTGKLVITVKSNTVTFLAGFDKAMTGNGKISKMKMPVLKEGGLPVMSLMDIVDVLGGKVENDETTYYVRI